MPRLCATLAIVDRRQRTRTRRIQHSHAISIDSLPFKHRSKHLLHFAQPLIPKKKTNNDLYKLINMRWQKKKTTTENAKKSPTNVTHKFWLNYGGSQSQCTATGMWRTMRGKWTSFSIAVCPISRPVCCMRYHYLWCGPGQNGLARGSSHYSQPLSSTKIR